MVVDEKSIKLKSLADLERATFAVAEGMIIDELVLKRLPHAQIQYFRTVMDCLSALKNGEVDGVVYDEPILKYISAHSPELYIIEEKFTAVDYGFAVNKNRPDLKKAIDDTVAEIKVNGIYEEMKHRWFPEDGALGIMPKIKLSGKNGKLKFGTTTTDRPFAFVVGDKVNTGFDIELAKRICSKLEMELGIHNMIFAELIPTLVAEKVDMIGAAMFINEERSKKILFSEPYFHGGVAVIVKK